jgi:putative ABC transport system permease protein
MVDLSYLDLGIVSLLVVASVVLAIVERLRLSRDIVVSCLRAFVQLTAVGIVLGALFRNVALHWVILVLAVMIGAAVQAAVGRVESPLSGIALSLALSIGLTSIVTLAVVIGAVIRPPVWYDPQFVIPLAGMTVGNCMTSAALAASRFGSDLRSRQDEVEALLALGATREQAVAPVMRDAIRAAMIPSIAGMMVVGIVSLPGMMTGQILAGRDPGQAVRYQIVVQYMLMFAAIMTSSLQVRLIRRQYFTPAHQLRRELLRGLPVNSRSPRWRPWNR